MLFHLPTDISLGFKNTFLMCNQLCMIKHGLYDFAEWRICTYSMFDIQIDRLLYL